MSDTAIPTVNTKSWQRIRQLTYIVLAATFLVAGGFVWTGPVQTFADQFTNTPSRSTSPSGPERENKPFLPLEAKIPDASFTALDLANHPDKLHGEYMSAPFVTFSQNHSMNKEHLKQFRDILNIYESRQAEDDNFTVRVIDRRTSGLLEVYTLEDVKKEFLTTENPDWEAIDELRRQASSRLIGKYRRRGIPMEDIMVKWGRLDQVKRARDRDLPFIEYEVNLSQTLGLSLLATELGTVETFNSDKMVSTVGARGRYQMMPYMLRKFGINSYTLWARGGGTVEVNEEWHPLLTMEAAFTIIKGYGNAVGHEITGISAYHTGPFNIFYIYNLYLAKMEEGLSPATTVMDAYLWALTEGFDEVSEDTGFRNYSRSYVATAYGSFKGTESLPVDTTKTHLTERVQTRFGEDLYLKDLLEALEPVADRLDWSYAPNGMSLYNRFRLFNPHIDLPAAPDSVFIPAGSDVYLTTKNKYRATRFFLPPGATNLLADQGLTSLSEEDVFRFDHNTYTITEDDMTVWDHQYAELVADVEYFGFTRENRSQLKILVERFEKLAEQHPTNFRKLQLNIIKLHYNLWLTRYWSDLSNNTAARTGAIEIANQPLPSPIGLTQRIAAGSIEVIAEESF